jgi:Domain of unknown function (DUF4304)
LNWFKALAGSFGAAALGIAFPEHGLPLITKDSIRRIDSAYPATEEEYAELVRKRVAVQRRLTREIDTLLKPLGYERKGAEWRRISRSGRSCFEFQKSRHGFDGYFNAGARSALESAQLHASTQDGIRFFRLADFCPEMPRNDAADALSYLRLHDDPAFCNGVMTVFRARMVPWLEARHALPAIMAMPEPSIMGSVRIFSDRCAACAQ